MLYVFNVDTGTMLTFDMSLAIESVNNLKLQVEKIYDIAIDKQVLLVSGGECLDPSARVCAYSAGTDTNPIYLFSKADIEATNPPPPSIEECTDVDFSTKVKDSQDLPATYNTVCHRTQLAQLFYEFAKEEVKVCGALVHEQHLQQQGWAAVIANFEDSVSEFIKRAEIFQKGFDDYMNERDSYVAFLQHFDEDLQTLAKIPLLPILLEKEQEQLENNSEEKVESSTETQATPRKCSTLLHWISAADSKSSMDQLYEHCSRLLSQFDSKIFTNLSTGVQRVSSEAYLDNMKDIKGLSDRLCGLEQLMFEANRYVQEQGDLAQSFVQNQNRATNIGDTSILPDLCASHRKQLVVMLNNQQQLTDIRRRCVNAKIELGRNLHCRLKWIMYMESVMLELDQRMVAYHDSVKRLRRHLEILQQIHLAPAAYLSAVAEVVRRRAFSQAFLSWASELACYLLTIHNDEITRRKDFQGQFDGHFLNSLFPGMEDIPPAFATEAPSIFDSSLPKLTPENIEYLKRELPDLGQNINVPDIAAINNLFMMKSFVKAGIEKSDDRGVEEKIVQVVKEVGLASNLDQNLLKPAESETCLTAHGIPHLKDLDRGCESETDTEEFEKVGQSPLELHFDKEMSSPRPRTHDASTITEVGDRNPLPPRKPPRTFQKSPLLHQSTENVPHIHSNATTNTSLLSQRTMSFSGSQSNTESFTNVKNPSLESIDELSSLKNFNSNTESCFNSHHQQMQSFASAHFSRSKSLSPHTPQSPKEMQGEQLSPSSPVQGHQPNEFITDEFYIDESLPSSLSIETGQSQGEFVRQLDTANNVVALLQDNLQTSRSEHDRLKSLLLKMSVLARQAIGQLRLELNDLKSCVELERSNMELQYESLTSSWENLTVEMDNKEKEVVQRITIDHELELNDYKRVNQAKDQEVIVLQNEILRLESALKNSVEEISELKSTMNKLHDDRGKEKENFDKDLNELRVQKEQSVKDVSDKLAREHKAEIENIRSRFRLMTIASMERSPSDQNLDRIERTEAKECVNHEAIILQVKENCGIEKEKAVNFAVLQESRKWESILNEKLTELKVKYELEKELLLDELGKKISEEKDKQIDMLREREAVLNMECSKYKSTIQQLTESETESQNIELLERVEALEKEKNNLEVQLQLMEKSRRNDDGMQDMGASVAVCEGKVNVATSPIKHGDKLSKSQTNLAKQTSRLSIDSCHCGDAVLVLWDPSYKNYRIVQESKHLYFLHSDCLETLGLNIKANEDRKMYFTGEVVEKDYCHAKKGGNRYNVAKDMKFFRVRIKPLPSSKEIKPDIKDVAKEKPQMSQSETAGPSIASELPPSDTIGSWSLPVTPLKQSPVEPQKSEMEVSTESNR